MNAIKEGIFAVGIDDAIHERGKDKTKLFFILCRGMYIENVFSDFIEIDGLDGTDVLIRNLHSIIGSINIIVTHGITVGGFNLLDLERIYGILKKPIIAVTENFPREDLFNKALQNLPDYEKRKKIVGNAGIKHSCKTSIGENPIYFYCKGIDVDKATKFLQKFAVRSRLPEQVLLAHKIASGSYP